MPKLQYLEKLISKIRLFKKPIVIVEIGNDWLKIAENAPSSTGRRITKAYFAKLADIKESIPDAISKIFKDLQINKGPVITYLPRHLSTVRILEFPSTDPAEINDMLTLQIGKQTPYSKEEIISSYRIIHNEKEGYTKVMLVITRHNLVSERVEALQKAGIEVEKVGMSSEGAYDWFNVAYMPEIKQDLETIILLDIDSNYSDFMVIKKRNLVFTRNMSIGANNLLGEPRIWQDKFIEELRHSIDVYCNEEGDIKINKIFLAGSGRNIQDLDRILSVKLDIPVETTNPLKNIRVKNSIDLSKDKNLRFISISSLLGIAMKHKELEFILTPNELRIQRLLEEKRRQLTIMGTLCISIVMMSSILLLANIYNKKAYLTQLKQVGIKKESNEIGKMRMNIDLVERRLNARGASISMLYEIYKLTPKEIYFTDINIEENKEAVLKGSALAMSNVFKFVTALENSRYFENVKTTHTTTKKEKDAEYVDFEIVCAYEKE